MENIETDEIRHALQLIQNAIEGDTTGLREAWILLSSHIDILERQSPLISNGATAEQARKILIPYTLSAPRSVGKGANFEEYILCRDFEEIAEKIVSYAALQSSQALAKQRNEVIEECKSALANVGFHSEDWNGQVVINTLEKTKIPLLKKFTPTPDQDF